MVVRFPVGLLSDERKWQTNHLEGREVALVAKSLLPQRKFEDLEPPDPPHKFCHLLRLHHMAFLLLVHP